MTAAQRQAAREEINNRPLTDFFALQESKHGAKNAAYHQYICPVCGSGTGKSGTGAFTLYAESKRCRCYACDAFGDKGQDTLGALKIIWSCSENEVFERLHIDINSKGVSKPVKRPEISEGNYTTNATGTAQNALQSVTERKQAATVTPIDFDKANSLLQAENNPGRKYLEQRGLNLETLNRFKIGVKYFYDNVNIIIPTNDVAYRERPIAASKESGKSRYYWKYAQKDRKQWDIFNETALDYNGYIFIVEGEIDAMSIEQSGFTAAAYCGTPNTERLIAAVKSRKHEPGRKFIIIQDIDESGAGQRAAAKIKEGLQGVGYSAYITSIPEYHDSNDFLKADSKGLKTWLSYQITEAMKEEITIMNETSNTEAATTPTEPQNGAAGEIIPPTTDTAQRAAQTLRTPLSIGTFMEKFAAERKQPHTRISTGIKSLDIALCGGLADELYILGAESSQGKSALSMFIAENIAAAGTHVLYFALEMSKSELIARGISRISHEYKKEYEGTGVIKKEYTAGQILYTPYDERTKEFMHVPYSEYEEYAKEYARRQGETMHIIDVTDGVRKAPEIIREVENYISVTGNKPLVVVDYLQMIAPDDPKAEIRTKIDSAINSFKGISAKYKIPVLVISSMNRTGYGQRVTPQSMKESGGIEYTGGVLLGLNLEAQTLKGATEESVREAAKAKPRKMMLEVMKFRNSEKYNDVKLDYYSAYNYFEETKTNYYDNPYSKADWTKAPANRF